MGKLVDKKRQKLHKAVDSIPTEKVDYVQGIIDGIILSIKKDEEELLTKTETKKKNFDFSDLAGTLKLPKNFDAVKWQKKLRDEWKR